MDRLRLATTRVLCLTLSLVLESLTYTVYTSTPSNESRWVAECRRMNHPGMIAQDRLYGDLLRSMR